MSLFRASLVLSTMLTLSVGAGAPDDARTFASEMLRGVGASEVTCPDAVLTMAHERELQVICATFEGDFQAFEYRWTMSLLDDAIRNSRDGSGRLPYSEPKTAWTVTEGFHERVYAVGQNALGIRFSRGYVLLAYR
jgi:hypothetical protein